MKKLTDLRSQVLGPYPFVEWEENRLSRDWSPPNQLQFNPAADWSDPKFHSAWSNSDDGIHSTVGSFDFDSTFHHPAASSTEEFDFEETTNKSAEHTVLDTNLSSSVHNDSPNVFIPGNMLQMEGMGKKGMRIPSSAAKVLRNWVQENSHYPYPSKEEKLSLVKQTGLAEKQVCSWFANYRRRYKSSHSSCDFSAESRRLTKLSTSDPTTGDWSLMSPLERWKNSPPEVEAAPLQAIFKVVAESATSKSCIEKEGPSALDAKISQRLTDLVQDDAPSIVLSESVGSARSSNSGSSSQSTNSNHSHGSFGRFYSNEQVRRRRRRRQPAMLNDRTGRTGRERKFQCTFCTDTFKSKHDWTRHEKTLHLSLESWTCAPNGPIFKDTLSGVDKCTFCNSSDISDGHIEVHRYLECKDKPESLRTFYRKDHLRQHLRLVHGIEVFTPQMETWKTEVTYINSRCGFCSQTFTIWPERNDHIANHFRLGALMKDWRGCRGLDPPVALAVDNAMPPYLIGIESMAPEPFSASRRAKNSIHQPSSQIGFAPVQSSFPEKFQPTPFENLTAHLGQFVSKVQAAGTPLTDEMIQQEARYTVFGDDDPWNQTAADNSEWLRLFKEGMGLCSATCETPPNLEISLDSHKTVNHDAFRLPWSADEWTPYPSTHTLLGGVAASGVTPSTCNITNDTAAPGPCTFMDPCMPWSWQSPECLVEFRRQNMQRSLCTSGCNNVRPA